MEDSFPILISALISIIVSCVSSWITLSLPKLKKPKIYVKFVGSRITESLSSLGYIKTAHGLSLHVPLWLDICNTTGVSKIIRNISLLAYKDSNFVAEFSQCQGNTNNPNKPGAIILGDEGAYTTVVPANSSKRLILEFDLLQGSIAPGTNQFNKLWLSYYDENDRQLRYYLIDVDASWIKGTLVSPKQWITLDKPCRTFHNDTRSTDELS